MPPPSLAPGSVADLVPFRLAAHDRWVLASCLARRLSPAVWSWGGFASAEVEVRVGRAAPRRPAVAVVRGEAPAVPVLRAPPLLVVELAPACAPQEWLALGVATVWSVGRDGAWVSGRGEPPRHVPAPGVLELHAEGAGAPLVLALPVQGSCSLPGVPGER